MSYQDGFQVVEDVEQQLQFFGGFGAEDFMAAMSGYGKQHQYDVFNSIGMCSDAHCYQIPNMC